MNLSDLLQSPQFSSLFESAYAKKLRLRHTQELATFRGGTVFSVAEDERYLRMDEDDMAYKGRFEAEIEMSNGSIGKTLGAISFWLEHRLRGDASSQILNRLNPYVVIESIPHSNGIPASELLQSEAFSALFENAFGPEIWAQTADGVAIIADSVVFEVTAQSGGQIDGIISIGCFTVIETAEDTFDETPPCSVTGTFSLFLADDTLKVNDC